MRTAINSWFTLDLAWYDGEGLVDVVARQVGRQVGGDWVARSDLQFVKILSTCVVAVLGCAPIAKDEWFWEESEIGRWKIMTVVHDINNDGTEVVSHFKIFSTMNT